MESINDYDLIKVIGEGSFAKVYLAKNKQTQENVAIKQVIFQNASEKEKQAGLNQVRLLASISHQNIIKFKTAFFDNDTEILYIVMQYAKKGDISHKIQYLKMNKKHLQQDEIWRFLKETASALKVLHFNNIIHRDLKSANIFIAEDGSYKIADFNVAKLIKNFQGLAETKLGTPLYASPEIWNEKGYNIKADIWSLGIVAYELCALEVPYPATKFGQLFKMLAEGKQKRIPRTYSDDLFRLIDRMIHKNPSKRPTADQIISYANHGVDVAPKQIYVQKNCNMVKTIIDPIQIPRLINYRLNKPSTQEPCSRTSRSKRPRNSMYQNNKENSNTSADTSRPRIRTSITKRNNRQVFKIPVCNIIFENPLIQQKQNLKQNKMQINFPKKYPRFNLY